MNLQSFLTGSRDMWFSLIQLSFALMNQDPITSEKKGMLNHSDFLIK